MRLRFFGALGLILWSTLVFAESTTIRVVAINDPITPVNYAGVLLILLALVLFIAEINIVSYGLLTGGGLVAMALGSLLLFDSPEPWLRLSWKVILLTVLAAAGFFILIVKKALSAQRRPKTTGREGLIGEEGTAQSSIDPEGKVFLHGEYWDARSDTPIGTGDKVVVEEVEGMVLKVRKMPTGD